MSQMKRTSKNANLGLRTEQAKQFLVRYIWDLKLKPGDKLPPHEVIRNKFGLGNATITRALKSLKVDGVLSAKRRVGTYVVDSQADGHAGRVIGLTSVQPENGNIGPAHFYLLHYLQMFFRSVGCQTVVFYCNPTHGKYVVGMDYFPGLKRSVEEHRLDAVVLVGTDISEESWRWIEERKMHPCVVGITHAPVGVMLDYESMTQRAIELLVSQGCKRPGIAISPGVIRDFVWPVFCRVTKNLVGFDPERFYFEGISADGGNQIARDVLARNPSDRPDGLAILDDQIAMGLISHLVRKRSTNQKYLPLLACQTNKQIPMDFPVDEIVRFEVDIDLLARTVVQMLIGHLQNPGLPWETQRIMLREITGNVEEEMDQVVHLRQSLLEKPIPQLLAGKEVMIE